MFRGTARIFATIARVFVHRFRSNFRHQIRGSLGNVERHTLRPSDGARCVCQGGDEAIAVVTSAHMKPILLLLSCAAAFCQTPTITEEIFHGSSAWVLQNGLIHVTVIAQGGHIAEMRLISDDPKKSLNPMLIPPDPQTPGSYMGHLVCFPSFGPASQDEARAGLTGHGEARMVEWKKTKSEATADGVTLWYAAELPKTQFRFERSIHVPAGKRIVQVEEWAENLLAFDRPINWMEHATVGPPFAEPGKTTLDVSATRGQIAPRGQSLKPGSPVEWPRGTGFDGNPVDLRVFQPGAKSGTYYPMRLDPARKEQFFTLFHPDYRLLIGYVFPSEGYPWGADWQDNNRRAARGIEFGSSPFDEGLRKSIDRGLLFDTPTFRWIGGKQRAKMEFTVFLMEIPEGFKGVKDARLENGDAVVTPR